MRLSGWVVWLCLGVGGCADTMQQRVREFNEDGVDLFRKGDYPHARESFQAALILKPHDANLLYNLGQCYERLGQPEKAEQSYRDCLVVQTNHVECRHALAVVLCQHSKEPDASRMIEDWLAHEPRRADAYVEHGWYFRQRGDLDRARSRYQTALEIDPDNVRALNELAQLYETMSRPERAVALYERSLNLQPDQPEVRHRLETLKGQGIGRPKPD
jgi:Flp pilus assembly protein TadD